MSAVVVEPIRFGRVPQNAVQLDTLSGQWYRSMLKFSGFSMLSRRIDGGLAQLGERLAGSQKVRGSSPLSSTFFYDFAFAGRSFVGLRILTRNVTLTARGGA